MVNLNSPFHLRLCTGLAIALGMILPQSAARAQSDGGYDLLVEIVEAINSVSEETAREAHAKCLAISKKVADRTDLDGAIVSGQSINCEQDFEALRIK